MKVEVFYQDAIAFVVEKGARYAKVQEFTVNLPPSAVLGWTWWKMQKQDKAEPWWDTTRSAMMGDIFVVDDNAWIVLAAGFEPVDVLRDGERLTLNRAIKLFDRTSDTEQVRSEAKDRAGSSFNDTSASWDLRGEHEIIDG